MAIADLQRIATFYAETAGYDVSEAARIFLQTAVKRLASGIVTHRPGPRGTREAVLRRFPYIIVYRVYASRVRIVRILHQARGYFR